MNFYSSTLVVRHKRPTYSRFRFMAIPPIELTVYSVGACAARILERGGPASVNGSTSRGCFLRVRSRWTLFLTHDARRGPLTLNLRGDPGALRALSAGTPVEIGGGFLQTGSPAIRLALGQAQRWKPPERPAALLALEERRNRQVATGEHLLGRPGAAGSASLLSMLLGLSPSGEAAEDPFFPQDEVERLRASLRSQDVRRILQALEWFLGRGPGLTPAGDDLAAGLLLALHRWGDVLCPGLDLAALSQLLLPVAYRKTGTLAANLVECAAAGQADERLVTALDGLMAGEPGPGECASLLLDYGSSSGCAAFLGMLLAEE